MLTSLYLFCSRYWIPFDYLVRDPAAIYGGSPFVGAVSHLGILPWNSTATFCLFAFFVLKKVGRSEDSFFFLISGLITTFLLLDDLFMLHEHIFPKKFGISENVVYAVYFAAMLVYFAVYHEIIAKYDYRIISLSCLFFALSLICGLLFPNQGLEFLLEEGFKFLGIFSWLVFFASSSYRILFVAD